MDERTGLIGATPEAKDAFSIEVARAWEFAFDEAVTPATRKVTLRAAMVLLRRRHLVVLASLRERALDTTIHKPIKRFSDALTYSANDHYMESRRESQDLLRATGVLVEDCLCEELPAAITNQYLSIKRAGAL